MHTARIRRASRATRHVVRRSEYVKAARAERRAVKNALRGGF